MASLLAEPVGRAARPAPRFLRPYRYFAFRYSRTWRGTLTTSILYPILYLVAMGIGLGHLVDTHLASHGALRRIDGVSYVDFIAPGLIVSTAMQWGTNESMWPVMAGLKWLKTYHALLATPIEVVDLVHGHLAWIATRVAASSAIFLAVLAAFGDLRSALALFAIPVAMLTGLAFAAPIAAFTATQENDALLPLVYRMCIVPLFLFSGTFFPISLLPGWVQVVARVTPLYHSVALARALMLGHTDPLDALGHCLYLLALLGLGTSAARRSFTRRLVL